MPGVDQILSAVVQQGADELRLGTDQAPVVLAQGTPRRFTMSPTPDAVLRQLLGDLLTPERCAELEQRRKVTFEHHASGVGQFKAVLVATASGGFDATFTQSARSAGAARPETSPRRPETSPQRSEPSPRRSDMNRQPQVTTPQSTPTLSEARATPPIAETPTEPLIGTPLLIELAERAARAQASDIHLEDGQSPYLRIDGKLQVFDNAGASVADYFLLDEGELSKILAGEAQELAFEVSHGRRLRVSLYRTQGRLAAAIRLLPNGVPALGELNLPLPLDELAHLPHGLVLFCGATGSGKSTTMAALCQKVLADRSVLLITLEDPIEFALTSTAQSIVRQRQVGRDVKSYHAGLRDALRGDPDVIMVGELRDAESIRLAMTAAETGHLVFASLHSGSAAACLERVTDAYSSDQRAMVRTQLAEALRAVVVQKLVPRARGKGRVPALEVMRVTHAVANVIREGRTGQVGTLLQSGKRDGMISLERCLADYVQASIISLECAKAAANDFDSLAMYLSK